MNVSSPNKMFHFRNVSEWKIADCRSKILQISKWGSSFRILKQIIVCWTIGMSHDHSKFNDIQTKTQINFVLLVRSFDVCKLIWMHWLIISDSRLTNKQQLRSIRNCCINNNVVAMKKNVYRSIMIRDSNAIPCHWNNVQHRMPEYRSECNTHYELGGMNAFLVCSFFCPKWH